MKINKFRDVIISAFLGFAYAITLQLDAAPNNNWKELMSGHSRHMKQDMGRLPRLLDVLLKVYLLDSTLSAVSLLHRWLVFSTWCVLIVGFCLSITATYDHVKF